MARLALEDKNANIQILGLEMSQSILESGKVDSGNQVVVDNVGVIAGSLLDLMGDKNQKIREKSETLYLTIFDSSTVSKADLLNDLTKQYDGIGQKRLNGTKHLLARLSISL